jgi:hypothetical protein
MRRQADKKGNSMRDNTFRLLAVSLSAAALLLLPVREAGAQEGRSLGTGPETTKEAGDVTKGYPGRPRETAIGARPTEEPNARSMPDGPEPTDPSTPQGRNNFPQPNAPRR